MANITATIQVELTAHCQRHLDRAQARMLRGDVAGAQASLRRAYAAMRVVVGKRRLALVPSNYVPRS